MWAGALAGLLGGAVGSEPASASRPRPGMAVGSVFGSEGAGWARSRVGWGYRRQLWRFRPTPRDKNAKVRPPDPAIEPHQPLPSAVSPSRSPARRWRVTGAGKGAPRRGWVRTRSRCFDDVWRANTAAKHGARRAVHEECAQRATARCRRPYWRAMHHEGPGPAIDPPPPNPSQQKHSRDRYRPANHHRRDSLRLPRRRPTRPCQSERGSSPGLPGAWWSRTLVSKRRCLACS